MKKTTIVFLIAAAMLTFLGLMTSCKTSGTLEGGFDAGPVGVKGGVTWTTPTPTISIGGTLPPGDCLQLDFYDKEGKLCGSTGKVRPPYVGSLPEGAGPNTPIVAQIVPCDKEEPEEDLTLAGPTATKLVKRRFMYWSAYPNITGWDPLLNTTIVADVWVSKNKKNDNVCKMLQRIAINGIGTPPPPMVDVVHFAAVKPASNGDATMVIACEEAYTGATITATGAAAVELTGGTVPGWSWKGFALDIDPAADKVDVTLDWTTSSGAEHFGSWFGWL